MGLSLVPDAGTHVMYLCIPSARQSCVIQKHHCVRVLFEMMPTYLCLGICDCVPPCDV
jgi:hypothetical protein